MAKLLKLEKKYDRKWISLFSIFFKNKKGKEKKWEFVSRKEDPINNTKADAVMFVPFIKVGDTYKLVITKEFRAPIWDYEWGFPAGLMERNESIERTVERELKEETGLDLIKINKITNPIYSSAGLTDESVVMVFIEVEGTIDYSKQEDSEDIEVFLMGIKEISRLVNSNRKIGAKSWGVLWHFLQINKIEVIK